jgi:hypothetical protein
MAPRTLASTWRNFEKLARAYLRGEKARSETAAALDELGEKVNKSRIVEALAMIMVHPHQGLEDVTVRFALSGEGGEYPEWETAFDEESRSIILNPVGIVRFVQECQEAAGKLRTPDARESFKKYRLHAYLAELAKLPSQLALYLHLLREVACQLQVTQVERKGGGSEEVDDVRYMRLLWAFKEMEQFFAREQGISLRSEYGFLWYESDWIVGKK